MLDVARQLTGQLQTRNLASETSIGRATMAYLIGTGIYIGKLAVGGVCLAVFETAVAKMRVFRVPAFLGAALMLALLGALLLFVSRSL